MHTCLFIVSHRGFPFVEGQTDPDLDPCRLCCCRSFLFFFFFCVCLQAWRKALYKFYNLAWVGSLVATASTAACCFCGSPAVRLHFPQWFINLTVRSWLKVTIEPGFDGFTLYNFSKMLPPASSPPLLPNPSVSIQPVSNLNNHWKGNLPNHRIGCLLMSWWDSGLHKP